MKSWSTMWSRLQCHGVGRWRQHTSRWPFQWIQGGPIAGHFKLESSCVAYQLESRWQILRFQRAGVQRCPDAFAVERSHSWRRCWRKPPSWTKAWRERCGHIDCSIFFHTQVTRPIVVNMLFPRTFAEGFALSFLGQGHFEPYCSCVHTCTLYIPLLIPFFIRYIHILYAVNISFMEAHSMGHTFACCIVSCTYVHRTEAIPWHPWHPLQQLWGFAMPIQVDANNFSVVLLVFFVKLGYQTIKNLGGNQHLLFKTPPPPKLNSSHLKSYRAPIGKKSSSVHHHSSGAMLWNFPGGYIPPNDLPNSANWGCRFSWRWTKISSGMLPMLSHSSYRRIGIHREKRRNIEDAKNLEAVICAGMNWYVWNLSKHGRFSISTGWFPSSQHQK